MEGQEVSRVKDIEERMRQVGMALSYDINEIKLGNNVGYIGSHDSLNDVMATLLSKRKEIISKLKVNPWDEMLHELLLQINERIRHFIGL